MGPDVKEKRRPEMIHTAFRTPKCLKSVLRRDGNPEVIGPDEDQPGS